jgi:hypothetical protein
MSFNATSKAWNVALQGSSKLVLLCLADHADDSTLEAFPSVSRISERTGLNRKTVLSCIAEMEKVGVISTRKKFGAGNVYHLNLDWKPVPKAALVTDRIHDETSTNIGTGTSTEIGTSTENGPVPILGLDQYQKRTLTSTEIGTLTSHEPVINQSLKKNRSRQGASAISLDGLPEQISQVVALAFIEHRKLAKPALTQYAFDLAMQEALKASSIGITPDQAINETIQAGWKGIKIEWLQNRLSNTGGQHNAAGRQVNPAGLRAASPIERRLAARAAQAEQQGYRAAMGQNGGDVRAPLDGEFWRAD